MDSFADRTKRRLRDELLDAAYDAIVAEARRDRRVVGITAAMPKAATRVKSPTARPKGPRNSAAIASSANTAGIPEPVKNFMVPD